MTPGVGFPTVASTTTRDARRGERCQASHATPRPSGSPTDPSSPSQPISRAVIPSTSAVFRPDMDHTPLLKGAPGDSCQCPHWGYVLQGRLTYRFADHEETVQAGDAFYLPPGHIPVSNEPDSAIVQFSPTRELRQVETVIMKNLQATQLQQ